MYACVCVYAHAPTRLCGFPVLREYTQLATAFHAVEEGLDVQSIADEDIREILSAGTTYLYRVTDSPFGLQQLIISIVEERRLELMRQGGSGGGSGGGGGGVGGGSSPPGPPARAPVDREGLAASVTA
jgi:hypothetical protein